MKTDLQRLLPRHFKIIDLCLAGLSRKQIADEVGLTTQAVSNITNSPLFQDEIARRRKKLEKEVDQEVVDGLKEARDLIIQNAKKAAQVHVDLLEEEDPRIRQASASAILQKAFGGSVGDDSKKEGGVVIKPEQAQVLVLAIQETKGGNK